MKLSKIVVFGVAAAMSFGAFADAANTMIRFSSVGDKYDDDNAVADGEWYALCWSGNEKGFAGIKVDCTPVDPADKVLLVAPLTKKDDGSREVYFQVDSKVAPVGGQYYVYVLDTRDASGEVAKADSRNMPLNVNGAISSQFYWIAGDGFRAESKDSGEVPAWIESAIAGAGEGVKIVGFEVTNDGVEISVEGLISGAKYNVRMGETPDKLESFAFTGPQAASGSAVTFVINNKVAKFFQLVRSAK